jgi:hypothetical protein
MTNKPNPVFCIPPSTHCKCKINRLIIRILNLEPRKNEELGMRNEELKLGIDP